MSRVQIGDKVKLKTLDESGQRAIVIRIQGEKLLVRLEVTTEELEVTQNQVTNFSLAARKAWEKMPNRRVGRPSGSLTSDRVSVTFRIDRQLWERFQKAENHGAIEDRTQTINDWLSEKLGELSIDRV